MSRVFEQHIRRSLPVHEELHRLVLRLAEVSVPEGGTIYDLGCASGALCRGLRERLPRARLIGVDSEQDMVATASASVPLVDFKRLDLRELELEPCDLVVCLYTLQFLPEEARPNVLSKIGSALRPGGALVLAEKVVRRDPQFETLCAELQRRFKREQGFTDQEILAKSKAIEGVLRPLNEDAYPPMLTRAGFGSVHSLLRHTAFEVWLATK